MERLPAPLAKVFAGVQCAACTSVEVASGQRISAAVDDGLAFWCTGNSGQCEGAVSSGVSSLDEPDRVSVPIAQWCAP